MIGSEAGEDHNRGGGRCRHLHDRPSAGETVVITDRGRGVAEIVPLRAPVESVIERGVREGWITPATDRSGNPPPRKPIPGYTSEQLLADLDKDREDRW